METVSADLTKRAFIGLLQFVIALALFLFVPAWSIHFWQAWLFIFVFSSSILFITVYFLKKDPALIQRRLKAGATAEKEQKQKVIQLLATIFFICTPIIGSLDHRFQWSHIPRNVVILGDALVALGLFIIFLVFKENTFTSSTIEIAQNQRVIDTGPYSLVRHPMYAASFVMFIGMPLAIGSLWAYIPVLFLSGTIVWRLLDEEKFLEKNLTGYTAYRQEVRYRLIPYIW